MKDKGTIRSLKKATKNDTCISRRWEAGLLGRNKNSIGNEEKANAECPIADTRLAKEVARLLTSINTRIWVSYSSVVPRTLHDLVSKYGL